MGIRTVVIATIGSWSAPVFACTLCHSALAASVRARLLQADLLFNACAVLLPLALLAWVVALIAGGTVARSPAE